MTTRPPYVATLLDRPLPTLHLSSLSASSNPPYDAQVQASISDGRHHPLLEVTLHLLNSDLFSAHFLVRKMEKQDVAKWLHSFLHAVEGDLRNARCWIRDTPPDVLAITVDDPEREAGRQEGHDNDREKRQEYRRIDVYAFLKGMTPQEVTADRQARTESDEGLRKQRWHQLVNMLHHLERRYGYQPYDGTVAYDSKEEKQHTTTMVLGEGWRRF
ncbi:uncharacterized protein PFL1_02839 [Pseudozyma flocculosa PF-1]|uniref:Uncharacterized protein n=1 Tax=Pseudozyma flocculosa PF-1 TaxID=1277687 RepID=A0A061HC62_9BASI|nr:uncharacterized protein PFL1_02839 [Pseudozyma flocculosa PF-1]EPQ29620.1 hypothetical protein PFL1_02839 [Pseudozyma flocculosa PF-1]